MTETAVAITRTVDAAGSFCPGPLMVIPGYPEGAVGDVIAGADLGQGLQDRHPDVDREGRAPAGLPRGRDDYDEIVVEKRR